MKKLFFLSSLLLFLFTPPVTISFAQIQYGVRGEPLKKETLNTIKRTGANLTSIDDKDQSVLPSPSELNSLFKAANLTSEVKDWDQFDKDVFYLKCKNSDLKYIQKSYPKLSPQKLKIFFKLAFGKV